MVNSNRPSDFLIVEEDIEGALLEGGPSIKLTCDGIILPHDTIASVECPGGTTLRFTDEHFSAFVEGAKGSRGSDYYRIFLPSSSRMTPVHDFVGDKDVGLFPHSVFQSSILICFTCSG